MILMKGCHFAPRTASAMSGAPEPDTFPLSSVGGFIPIGLGARLRESY